MKKILFISHDASRTGAPLILLYFLQWLKEYQPHICADILVLKGGALYEDFKLTVNSVYNLDTIAVEKFSEVVKKKILKKIGFARKSERELIMDELVKNNYDLIYANTVISIPIAVAIKNNNSFCKVIAHIHELNTIITLKLPSLISYIEDVYNFIAPSYLVQNSLNSNWNIPQEKLQVVYEFSKIKYAQNVHKTNTIFTVGGSGTVHWRKGSDVFIQIARYIKAQYPKVQLQFVWVGSISHTEQEIIKNDLNQLQLTDIVKFVGEQENPIAYYKNFDVFLMPSREDPFPLVCIEVGMLGKPIICFEKASGTAEIIEKGGGFIVPYLSIEAMAEKIIHYYNNLKEKEQHGEFNKTAFAQFTPEIVCPQLFTVIENTLKNYN